MITKMPSLSNQLITWSESIDALESINPLAFNYYYDFHSTHGLKERNLSPFKRLSGIGDYCESAGENLTADFIRAIAEHFSIVESDLDSYCVSEQGFLFSDSHAHCNQ
jgi:hypothetical protein